MKNSKKNESGMLTVEATLILVPFLMVIVGIISFINVFMVHNRIQYGIFQAGSEMSAYTYLYQAFSLRAADIKLKEDADKATEELDKLLENFSSFLDDVEDTEEKINNVQQFENLEELQENINEVDNQVNKTFESGKETYNQVLEMIKKPETFLQGAVFNMTEIGIEKLKSLFTGWLSNGMVNVYIQTDTMSAKEYLEKFGVVDGKLDYGNSIMFGDDDRRMIDIIVEYDIEIFMFKLFLKDPTIHMVQRCTIPAWLDGDGGSISESKKGD